jgi:hypothetical protein
VKRINNLNDDPVIAKQTLREIKILKFFNGSDNIIGIRDVVRDGVREVRTYGLCWIGGTLTNTAPWTGI